MRLTFAPIVLGVGYVVADISESQMQALEAMRSYNSSLLWGTYRPNLYFGIRPRIPESLFSGLMWHGLNDHTEWQHIRHQCEEGHNLKKYGWKKHDGRSFGVHEAIDQVNGVSIDVEFAKNVHDMKGTL